MNKSLCLTLILAISATSGCSHFSSSAREERAYAKYVNKSKLDHEKRSSGSAREERAYAKYLKKSKIEREKRQAAILKEKAKIPPPGPEAAEPQETQASTSEGPQAVPSESNSQ